MRLRRVVLSGFKTFARRTEVELGTGITAVVGPNGSGKSNLVDAIRWGLGETNARELRGARMDEVIHAGAPGRPQLGMAQVDLVLDNEDGRLPCEDAEVELSRRVTRGGDSEYRVNGARARLRDLERMLSATGLTQSGYAVVAQNDVDGIIEASPAQRRTLVEEAAGVRGLRSARDDTLTRVGGVEVSLLRLRDLLADAEPRLAELGVQAAAALDQRELAARLAELRGSLAREEWRAGRAQLRRARHRLEVARTRAGIAAEAEVGFANRLEAEKGRWGEARAARDAAAQRLETARLEAEHSRGESRRFDDRATSHGLQRAAAAAEEDLATREIERQRGILADLGSAGEEATELIGRLAERTERLTEDVATAERVLRDARSEAAALAAASATAQRQQAAAAAAVRDEEARLRLLQESAAGIEVAAAGSMQRCAALTRQAAEATSRGAAAGSTAASATAELTRRHAAQAAGRAVQVAVEAELSAATALVSETEARAAALRGQVEGSLGGGPVAVAVAAGELAGRRLVECFQVLDPADAPAVEAALEAHLGAFVVGDMDAAARRFAGAGAREELLAAGLPALGPEPVGLLPSGVRPVLAAIVPDPRAAGALEHCLERAWLAVDLRRAREAVGVLGGRAVLPDGTVVTAAGRRGGGRPGETIALAAARRDAEAALERLRQAAALKAHAVAVAADAAADHATAVQQGAAAVEEARAAVAAAGVAAAAATAAIQAEEERRRSLERELEARSTAIAAVRAGAAAAARVLEEARAAAGPAAGAAAAAAVLEEAAAELLAGARAALRDHELAVARAEPEARDLQRRLAGARTAAEEAEQRARGAELQRCAAEEAALAALVRAAERRRSARAAEAGVRAAEAAIAAAAVPMQRLEATVTALEADRSEVAVARARAADELDAAQEENEALEARVGELADVLRTDELDEGPEPDAAEAAERAEREIVRLERRVAALGAVNGLAPEQHAALAARTGGLRRDHDDLANACADLRALAAHVTVEIEARFSAVFGAVAYHFRLLFEELFPGGRATLRLEAPGDGLDAAVAEGRAEGSTAPRRPPAAAGVEILAQPLGKRLVGLSLLSGGERALTALAVILALQQVNPSPFYVLDEVDAPLDDANIGRFTRVLRRLAERQQFVVVTHNHATMAAADALYGVTMGDDGISRLLSVRFTKGHAVPHLLDAAAAS
ncbi:MAG TPA: chromosome segregation protein SMC [Candidatus Dormibacteraeota bacterium]